MNTFKTSCSANQLTYTFTGQAQSSKDLTSTYAHIFVCNWQMLLKVPHWGTSNEYHMFSWRIKTSEFHGEFMSPALFLFEVLKMGKLTRGPLVLYHLPKYWSRKPVIKNNFRILKKPQAYLQTILKAPLKFQKDWLKTVVGVTGTKYLLLIRFCSIRTQKMFKSKMRKKW